VKCYSEISAAGTGGLIMRSWRRNPSKIVQYLSTSMHTVNSSLVGTYFLYVFSEARLFPKNKHRRKMRSLKPFARNLSRLDLKFRNRKLHFAVRHITEFWTQSIHVPSLLRGVEPPYKSWWLVSHSNFLYGTSMFKGLMRIPSHAHL
jgi:hypothetical protein